VLVDYIQLVETLVVHGQAAGEVVQLYAALEDIGRMMGVEEKRFVVDAERRNREALVNQRVQQSIQAAMAMQKQSEQVAAATAPAA
jgi:hypothetical protein